MSGKRKAVGGRGGDGGRSKRKYVNKSAPSGARPGMPVGSRGVLVSCVTSKEQQAGREAANLFAEAYEELGGTWKSKAGGAPADDADAGGDAGPTDIAAALASEVAELKEPAKQPFRWELVGINSVVFLEARDPEGPSPTALVQHLCKQAAQTKVNRTKWCNRFYPVEHTCYASMEKIGDLAAAVAAQHFPADATEGIEFAVQYDARAAPPLDRMEVINAFATRIQKPHSVNLGAPQKTVLVNVVKSTLGVAVVDQFKELCRFNIRSLAMSDEEREVQRQQQGSAPAAPGAAEAKAKAAARKAAQDQGQQDGQQQEQQGEQQQQQPEQQPEQQQAEDAAGGEAAA
ncbi:THUMP domain-containing 1-like protein [Chlorella sorokiniana]|uniref:THUMP domain-containing 1-like protein n=1 Tax=Chlorella sorokiniana TaxID=3076 RepID=A0A2P6TPX7_CHLSO|nr:THUMP domain-containing 1-like protein [Chlorella sorokiniana]|eukprot:PRW56090.1 THUMP domain-containing 1-like protein [Chlorella sorokiniana]